MADSLPTLIKLAEYKVEQAQMALAAAQKSEDAALRNLQHWQQAGAAGYHRALTGAQVETDITQLASAGIYLKKAKEEEQKAAEVYKASQQKTAECRKILTEAYSQQKRYELLHERQKLEARKKLQKKQQDSMEDTAAQKRRP